MGTAFAEGMIDKLFEEGYTIGTVVHINAFQAASCDIDPNTREKTIDYQLVDDPVINNPVLALFGWADPGPLPSADVRIHESSDLDNIFFVHRSPIWEKGHEFWGALLEESELVPG